MVPLSTSVYLEKSKLIENDHEIIVKDNGDVETFHDKKYSTREKNSNNKIQIQHHSLIN